ncbi:MAG: aminotransferase class V-fold PLP-dependent enzyme [Spirochaetes bacterium]|nr:aminotransferase class V-fold PLP-dependent enzyme [Spirochaetota bacterium]
MSRNYDAGRYAEFLAVHPDYAATAKLDELRATEYPRLDAMGQVYLDYTGGGLFADSQIDEHVKLLRAAVYGNPHSTNPSSQAATILVHEARGAVLEYFDADPDEYTVVFTQNASGALKLVGESYPFSGGRYLLSFDNHNSVNGIREFARCHGASVTYLPIELPELRISEALLCSELAKGAGGRKLFAYPAQSNFSGVQHPLEWIELAHDLGWDVLLDGAAFVPTNRLNLAKYKPDFVPVSFYKMFGYPTGIGALIARRKALAFLQRPWFAGGTITVASVQGDKYFLEKGPAGFEDGTLNYLGIPAVKIGLDYLKGVGIDLVHERAKALLGWLLDKLKNMKHGSGLPLVRIYGPTTMEKRGGSMALNFFDARGKAIDHRKIEAEANKVGISLRTGCFCNPGAGEVALGISRDELVTCFSEEGHQDSFTTDDLRGCLLGKSNGAVRLSTGIASNFADVETLLEFAKGFLEG